MNVASPGLRFPHGARSLVVRGTVERIIEPKAYLWGLFKGYPAIRVAIDREQYELLEGKLGETKPARIFKIVWGKKERLPHFGARVWIRFAHAGELESFFSGAPPISLMDFGTIDDESKSFEGELLLAQPRLPLPASA